MELEPTIRELRQVIKDLAQRVTDIEERMDKYDVDQALAESVALYTPAQS
jgi:hypothetical protein